MNANDIRDRASSFFERLKAYAAFLVRYIVFTCRKYPLIALLFLLIYAFFLYRFLNPNLSIGNNNLPIPTQQPTPINSQPTTSDTTLSTVEPAQVSAIKSGSDLSLKWSSPVEDPLIYSEKELLESNCLSSRCNVELTDPVSQVEVYWRENENRYVKNFKLAGGSKGVVRSSTISDEELKEQAVAQLEQKHKQLKQKRIDATKSVFKKGKIFQGTISHEDESQPIKLMISEVINDNYIVEISNPSKEISTQIFEGKITEAFKGKDFGIRAEFSPEKSSAFLLLKSRSPNSDLPEDTWRFYKEEIILILNPTDLGVDGVAESMNLSRVYDWDYKIVLRS